MIINQLRHNNSIIHEYDVIIFWISSDLWSNNYVFDYFYNNVFLLPETSKIVPIVARHTTGFDTFTFFQENIKNVLPRSGESIPFHNLNKRDQWYENVASEVLDILSLPNNTRIKSNKSVWSKLTVENRIGIILAIITTIIAIMIQTPSFIADYREIGNIESQHILKSDTENKKCIFPEKYNKDTLYILITRFEDFEKENDTECYGRNIERRLDIISKTKNLPIRFCYNDQLFPNQSYEAAEIRKKHNADILIWGNLQNAGRDCSAEGFCIQYTPSDSMIRMLGGKNAEPENIFQKNISSHEIQLGLIKVGNDRFDDWIIGLYNTKIGQKNPDLFIIDDNWENEKKLKLFRMRGALYANLNLYEKAILDFSKVLAINNNDSQTYGMIGFVESQCHHHNSAINNFAKSIQINKNDPAIYYYRSHEYLNLHNHKVHYLQNIVVPNSLKDISMLEILDTSTMYLKMALNDINISINLNEDTTNLIFILQRCKIYELLGMVDSAYINYNQLIFNHPNSSQLYYNKGLFSFNLKKYYEALSDFSNAIILEPNNYRFYLNKGDCFKLLNKKDSMILYYQYALKIAPNNLTAINRFAEGLDFFNNYDKSVIYYQQAIDIDTSLKYIFVNKIAENYNKNEKYKYSINICTQQIKLTINECDLIDIRYQRALAYFNLRNYEKSEKDLEIIVQNYGGLENSIGKNYFLREFALNKVQIQDIILLLAKSQYLQKKYEPCIKNCLLLIENEKYQKGIVNQMRIKATELLAFAQNDIKQYKQAIDSYESLILLDSIEPTYFNNKSDCLMSLNLYDQAIPELKKSIELLASKTHPFNIEIPKPWFNLGYCHFMVGDYVLSIKSYIAGVKIFFGFLGAPLLVLILVISFRKKIIKFSKPFLWHNKS